MPLCPGTSSEYETLPHAVLTSDADWDHNYLDSPGDVDNEIWNSAQSSTPQDTFDATYHRELILVNQQDMHYFYAIE